MKQHEYEDEMSKEDHAAVEQMLEDTKRDPEYQQLASGEPEAHQQAISDHAHEESRLDELAVLIGNLSHTADVIRNGRENMQGESADVPLPTEHELEEAADISASLIYDAAIFGKIALKELEAMEKIIKSRVDRALNLAAELMAEEGTQSIDRHGQLLFLKQERYIKPKIDDLLPPEVTEGDPQYEQTVETCKASAKARLIHAIKNSELSDLVSEGYNSNSLRARLVGKHAELDEDGDPIIPESIQEVITIDSSYKAVTRKSSSKKK